MSPCVRLFTLKIVFRWGGANPRAHHDLLGALSGPQIPRRKLCLHFILYLATPLMNIKTFLFLLVHIQNCKGEEVTSCITF